MKKDLLCETIPSLSCLGLALLKLFVCNDLFKLLQGYHSNTLDSKKLMDQRWPHMVQFNEPDCHSDNKSQCYIEIFKVRNRWK